jgi:rfaE bifunctional protein kinase chain/domain
MTARLLPDFTSLRVAVVGDAIADRYVHARPSRLSREAPVPVFVETGEEVRLGGAANVAANLAMLGCQTTLVAALGSDAIGRELLRGLERLGVDVIGADSGPDHGVPVKTRVLASEPHRTPQQVLRIDREPRRPVDPHTLTLLAREFEGLEVDAVLYSDYGYGDLALFGAADLRHIARGARRVIDPRRALPPFARLDAVTPNLEDFTRLARIELARTADEAEFLDRLACEAMRWREGCGLRHALVTLGNRGMLLAGEAGVHRVPASGREGVVDVSGAGDTAAAVFTAALALDWHAHEAMALANAAAGEVVMESGTAPIDLERLRRAWPDAPQPVAIAEWGAR